MNPRTLILDMTRRFRAAGVPDPEVDSAALLAFLLYGFSLPGYLCTMLYEPIFVRLEEE